jgi:hypothetical protein
MRHAILVFVVLTMASCSTGPLNDPGTFLPPRHYQALEIAKLCCAGYRDIQYVKLQRGIETKTVISPDSPVFEFDGRRSFFAAFELPTGSNRIFLVTTVPVNMLWNPAGHVIVPAVQFLDDAHKPIELLEPRYEPNSRFPRGSWAEAQVRVPNAARYAILLEDRNARGVAFRDRDQPSGSLFVRSGPTGQVSVLLLGG